MAVYKDIKVDIPKEHVAIESCKNGKPAMIRYDADGNAVPRKPGVKPGTKRADINLDGTPRKKPGVLTGIKRGIYNKDGSLRQNPGPKSRSKHQPNSTGNEN